MAVESAMSGEVTRVAFHRVSRYNDPPVWLLQRTVGFRGERLGEVSWTISTACPAAIKALESFERVPAARFDIKGVGNDVPGRGRGMDGADFEIHARGMWVGDLKDSKGHTWPGRPHLSLYGWSASPVALVVGEALEALDPCWRPDMPAIP